MSAQATFIRDIFSVVHITPPTNVGGQLRQLLNFQIVFNTFLRHQRLFATFSAVALFLSFNSTGELYDAIGRFHFYFTGRDGIVRQQLGFDFTGRGRIAGITFHGTFFIVARNVKFTSLTEVTPSTPFAAFTAFQPAHGFLQSRSTTPDWFRQKYPVLLILSWSTSAALLSRCALSSKFALFIELSTFALRFRFRFAPCPLLRFLQGRTCRNGRGQHYGQQVLEIFSLVLSHRFLTCLMVCS